MHLILAPRTPGTRLKSSELLCKPPWRALDNDQGAQSNLARQLMHLVINDAICRKQNINGAVLFEIYLNERLSEYSGYSRSCKADRERSVGLEH